MWIFTRYGFFSVACAHMDDGSIDPETVMVRTRRKAHLENLKQRFPALARAETISLPDRDYLYRLIAPKAVWVAVIGELAEEQDWSNFKNEAARFQGKAGTAYVHALHDVWSVMYRLQQTE